MQILSVFLINIFLWEIPGSEKCFSIIREMWVPGLRCLHFENKNKNTPRKRKETIAYGLHIVHKEWLSKKRGKQTEIRECLFIFWNYFQLLSQIL